MLAKHPALTIELRDGRTISNFRPHDAIAGIGGVHVRGVITPDGRDPSPEFLDLAEIARVHPGLGADLRPLPGYTAPDFDVRNPVPSGWRRITP
jgi:hypothetical protein